MKTMEIILFAILAAGFIFTCIVVINHQNSTAKRQHRIEMTIRKHEANIKTLFEMITKQQDNG